MFMALSILALATEPTPSAWVLVDQAARDAGVLVEVSGQEVDGTLPVEVEADLELFLSAESSRGSIWAEAGWIYQVQGPHGRLRAFRPGVDVDVDAVALQANENTARDLAETLEVTLEPDKRRWILRGPGVLYDLAFVAVPNDEVDLELLEVPRTRPGAAAAAPKPLATGKKTRLVQQKEARERITHRRRGWSPVAGVSLARWVAPAPPPPLAGPVGPRPVERVAWYCFPRYCLALGVDGFARRCDETGCHEAGAWFEVDPHVAVGESRYAWSGGMLVEVSP